MDPRAGHVADVMVTFIKRSLAALAAVITLTTAAGSARADDMEHGAGAPPPTLAAAMLGVDARTPANASQETRDLARKVGRDLVCLCGTCPKLTITDCTCGWAHQVQTQILNALHAGKTRDEAVVAYRKAYGDHGLAMIPSDRPLAAVAWALPYVAAIGGLGMAFVIGMRLKRKKKDEEAAPAAAPQSAGDDDAKKELARELEDLE